MAAKSSQLRDDVNVALEDHKKLIGYLEKNPINAWAGGAGTEGERFFSYDKEVFRTTFDTPEEDREALQDLTRELAEWRLAKYLDRGTNVKGSTDHFACRVSHTNGRPILFLPSRDKVPGLPEDWTSIRIDGEEYEANFVKIAINVIRKPGNSGKTDNVLPRIARTWFGPDAGLPGTNHEFIFKREGDELVVTPGGHGNRRPTLGVGRRYAREQIPALLGFKWDKSIWQQGFIPKPGHIILLVTLEKDDKPEEHQYSDAFLSPTQFRWQSQNRTSQEGKHGQAICNHVANGVATHLFVRKTAKKNGRTSAFYYCGEVEFASWEGEKPITVMYALKQELPGKLVDQFIEK